VDLRPRVGVEPQAAGVFLAVLLLVTIPAVLVPNLAVLFTATTRAGAGFGMGFLGAFRAVLAQAGPTGRVTDRP
jgi:hypothetical protein